MKFSRGPSGRILSVLLPTRGRLPLALASLSTIRTSCVALDWAREVEVLIRVDEDDPDMGEWLRIEERLGNAHVYVGPRHRYAGHHLYYNELETMACGDWLLLWNDDATFEGQGWDRHLLDLEVPAHCSDEVCMVLGAMGDRDVVGEFPLTRRAASQRLGAYARSPQVDTWLLSLYWRLGACVPLPALRFAHRFQADALSQDVQHDLPLAQRATAASGPLADVDRAALRGLLERAGVVVGPYRA